jgi:hypothetical protein
MTNTNQSTETNARANDKQTQPAAKGCATATARKPPTSASGLVAE